MMEAISSPSVALLVPRNGVLVLSGYGIRIAVERGQLVVSDGAGRERRSGQVARAGRDFKRLVIIGHTGTVSLDALRWLHDVSAAFVQLDEDGQIIAASGQVGLDDARLRRAQALASTNGVGIALARDLLERKLAGQTSVLAALPDTEEAVAHIARAREMLATADTPARLMLVEADAAQAYWQAWKTLPVPFIRKDAGRVPEHWQTFAGRNSPLTNTSRNATTPANAILNYLYAILEVEARLAALTVGLDPGIGVLHADLRARDSLACDLMEAVRPAVDGYVLRLLRTHTFRAADFFETRQGVCRILPSLAKQLAETAPRWATAIAPVAEHVARTLMEGQQTGKGATRKVPTPLTQANRSAGRDAVRVQPKPTQLQDHGPKLAKGCKGCGVPLASGRRGYCDTCLAQRREEQKEEFSAIGVESRARLRAEGQDTSHGGLAGQRRGATHVQRMREAREWEAEHGAERDPEAFKRDILPKLQGVPLRKLMEATGLSLRYCSLIRRGDKTPHPKHWILFERM